MTPDTDPNKNPQNTPTPDALAWTPAGVRHIVQDQWIDFRASSYRLPDGKIWSPFYTYSRRDYVVIAATDTEGRYITVRQFRQGIRCVTNEFVAGGIEGTARPDIDRPAAPNATPEQALAAAKRELREESGYESDEWTPLLTTPSNATISDNYAYLFRATNCRKVSGQDLDETEFLHVHLITDADLREMIRTGAFQQAMHVLAYHLARQTT